MLFTHRKTGLFLVIYVGKIGGKATEGNRKPIF